jgi:NAD(P)H-dependent FMN reductase
VSAKPRVLFLVGSPKGSRSTSEVLAAYLAGQLNLLEVETSRLFVQRALKSDDARAALLAAAGQANVLVFVCPLYVDSIPAGMIRGLEFLAAHPIAHPRKVMALVNSGFPESHQNDTALAVFHQFARETGMDWIGGLGLGMGAAIDGKPMDNLGGMTRNLKQALEITAQELAAGRAVPDAAVRLLARPLMPRWIYLFMGNLGWKRQARRHKAGDLRAKPYG